jgi:DnaJ-class molecular chaperone
MSRIGNYVVGLQEMVSTIPCPYCNGDGQVEVALAPDCFREDDCENCNGSGEIVLEDEYE